MKAPLDGNTRNICHIRPLAFLNKQLDPAQSLDMNRVRFKKRVSQLR